MITRTRKEAEEEKIAQLESRFIRTVKNMVPQWLRPLVSEYFRSEVSPLYACRNAKPPLWDLERLFSTIVQRWVEALFKENPELTPEEREQIRTIIATEDPTKILKNLRPQVENLRSEFLRELGRINPHMLRGPDGSAAIDELQSIRQSAFTAWKTSMLYTGAYGLARRRFIKRALSLLPNRLKLPFLEVCRNVRLYTRLKPFRPYIIQAEYEFLCEIVLFGMRHDLHAHCQENTLLKGWPLAKRVFREAFARKDWAFFAHVHELATTQPPVQELGTLPKLTEFLLRHWATQQGDIPALYKLSRQKLCAACEKHLNTRMSVHSVDKARQRLGLITLRKADLTSPSNCRRVGRGDISPPLWDRCLFHGAGRSLFTQFSVRQFEAAPIRPVFNQDGAA